MVTPELFELKPVEEVVGNKVMNGELLIGSVDVTKLISDQLLVGFKVRAVREKA